MNRLFDILVTLICWVYFIFAFLFFFSFFYVGSWFFAKKREQAFQYLNFLFFNGFFALLRFLAPHQKWEIDPRIREISGSIIVCNHLSYLDPLLLISLLKQQKSIVKSIFFKVPVFGWIIKTSGYLPAASEGKNGERMIEQLGKMEKFLKNGGNLFVFPEGTRSRDGSLGALHKGVFKIARMCRCSVEVLALSNSDKLFTPGKFFFNTTKSNTIKLTILDCIASDGEQKRFSADKLEKKVRRVFQSGGVS